MRTYEYIDITKILKAVGNIHKTYPEEIGNEYRAPESKIFYTSLASLICHEMSVIDFS